MTLVIQWQARKRKKEKTVAVQNKNRSVTIHSPPDRAMQNINKNIFPKIHNLASSSFCMFSKHICKVFILQCGTTLHIWVTCGYLTSHMGKSTALIP